jgi:hypothetical protein
MSTPIAYAFITPRCTDNGAPLYLTVNGVNNNASISVSCQQTGNTDAQQWEVQHLFNGAVYLINRASGLYLSAPVNNNSVVLVTANEALFNADVYADGTQGQSRSTWNLCPPVTHAGDIFTPPTTTAPYGAIQLALDTSMNLNVQGNGPYKSGTPVLAWSWGGGADNEVWQLIAA